MDENQAKELERKFREATFDLEDFLGQIQSVKKMGSLSQIMEMIPGMNQLSKKMPLGALDDGQVQKVEAMIRSMTPDERRRPDIINGSRRRRIAKGSGTTPQDINQLLNQFRQTQKLVHQMSPLPKPGKLDKYVPVGGKLGRIERIASQSTGHSFFSDILRADGQREAR